MKCYEEWRRKGSVLHTIKRRKANWISHSFRRNCLLKHVIEWKIEVIIEGQTGRGGRRRKQILDDLRETIRYRKIKEETPDRFLENSLWKRLGTWRKTGCCSWESRWLKFVFIVKDVMVFATHLCPGFKIISAEHSSKCILIEFTLFVPSFRRGMYSLCFVLEYSRSPFRKPNA